MIKSQGGIVTKNMSILDLLFPVEESSSQSEEVPMSGSSAESSEQSFTESSQDEDAAFYLSPSGTDSGTCIFLEQPCKTIEYVFDSVSDKPSSYSILFIKQTSNHGS